MERIALRRVVRGLCGGVVRGGFAEGCAGFWGVVRGVVRHGCRYDHLEYYKQYVLVFTRVWSFWTNWQYKHVPDLSKFCAARIFWESPYPSLWKPLLFHTLSCKSYPFPYRFLLNMYHLCSQIDLQTWFLDALLIWKLSSFMIRWKCSLFHTPLV